MTNKVKGLFGAAPPPDLPKIRNENEAFIDGKFTNVACINNISFINILARLLNYFKCESRFFGMNLSLISRPGALYLIYYAPSRCSRRLFYAESLQYCFVWK